MRRVVPIVAAVLAVVGLAALFVLPRFLDPERYRPRLQQMLGEVTGREVAIGPMRLHVFPVPGITADGFTLGEDPAFGKEPFLTAGRIDARVRLMPLFSSRLDVVSFDIDRPVARLHRDASGRWNLASLIETSTGRGAPAGESPASGGGFAVTIERFRLVQGTLEVADEGIARGSVHRIEGRQIDLTLSDLSMTSAIGIDLALDLPGAGKGTLEGKIGPRAAGDGSWPIDARVRIAEFTGGTAAPYLAAGTGLRLAGGAFDLDAAVKGTAPQSLDVQGDVVLKRLQLASFDGKGRSSPIDGSVSVDATITPADMKIRKAEIRLGGASVALSGAVTDRTGTPAADLRAVASKVAWRDIAPLVALAGPVVPRGLAADGEISLDATARGPFDRPETMAVTGTAAISGFEYTDPSLKEPIRGIGATVAFQRDRADLTGLAASLGRSRVSGACTIRRFERPVIDVDLAAPLLDVDEILTFMPSGRGGAAAAGGTPSLVREVTVRGSLAVDAAKATNLALTAARARLDVVGGEARMHDVSATLYGGTLAGDVTAGLVDAGPPFAMSARVQGVDFNALCGDFSKDLAGLVHGTLESSLDVKGRGLDTAGLRENLAGTATLALRNGKLTSFGFLKQLAAVLEAAGGRGIGKDETPFESLTGTFAIRDGRATTQDLRLVSADLEVRGRGSIGLDQTIGMDVGVLLSEATSADMVAKTPSLEALKNEKGQLALDVKVGGTLQKPAIAPDPEMLKRAAEKSVKKKGKDALRRLLDKKTP